MPTPAATPSPEPSTPATPAAPTPEPRWELAWSDEFDGAAGSPPDPATWTYELGDGTAAGNVGWGNQERESYTKDPANVALDGKGHLRLTVQPADGTETCWYGPCEYTSARILTRGLRSFQYGKIEVRLRQPAGYGIWPAAWLLGDNIGEVGWPNCGEIDIMEWVGRAPNDLLATAHGPGYYGSSGKSTTLTPEDSPAAGFHTYTVEWGPGELTWLYDGVQYHRVTRDDVAPSPWVFDAPFFLILNVAVGGTLGGLVDPDLVLPQAMVVDYVRVYEAVAP